MNESQKKLIAIGFVAIFFLGRLTASEHVRTEVKAIKVTDQEAIARAVELERKKILAQFKQNKTIDKIKLPDGTEKTHISIASEKISAETIEASNRYNLNVHTNIRDESQTSLKSPANDFAIELLLGKEKSNLFSTLPQESLIFGANISYRIFGGTWIGMWGLWEERQFYGVSVRQEF